MSASSLTNFNQLRQGFRRRFVVAMWNALPGIMVFVLLMPLGFPKFASSVTEVLPPFSVLALFFWSMNAPERLGYGTVFFAGLVMDTLMSTPFGSSAIILMILRYMIAASNKDLEDEGFLVAWIYCGVLLFLMHALQWSSVVLFQSATQPLTPVFVQWMLGVLIYPIMHVWFYNIDRAYFRRYWYLLKPD